MKTLLFLFLISTRLFAQESVFPQFDFNLINPFLPGKKVSQIPIKYGPPKKLELKDAQQVNLYKVVGKDGYYFPLIIQHLDDQILDFYTRPPSYLLHDFFHRDLIAKYGLQNEYSLVNGSGYYTWNTKDVSIYYQGECTITCFPVFYSQVAAKSKLPPTYKSLGKIFEDNLTLFE